MLVQGESFRELPSVDKAVLVKIIMHPDRCFNVYCCGERVDVTEFSTRGGVIIVFTSVGSLKPWSACDTRMWILPAEEAQNLEWR